MLVCCVPYIAYIEVLKDETCEIEKQYAPGRAKKQTKNKQQALSSAPQIQTITASFAKAPRPSQTPSASSLRATSNKARPKRIEKRLTPGILSWDMRRALRS